MLNYFRKKFGSEAECDPIISTTQTPETEKLLAKIRATMKKKIHGVLREEGQTQEKSKLTLGVFSFSPPPILMTPPSLSLSLSPS